MTDPRKLDSHPWFREDPDAWVRKMVQCHFHPDLGAPYSIRRSAEIGIDAIREIRTVKDLVRLGPMDIRVLSEHPSADLVPLALSREQQDLIHVESAGTTGPPKCACYSRRDFIGAFIASFRPVAESIGFPRGTPWLFIGPTGPHAIGRAARELPRVMESPEPFCVDFDPRWVRKLPEGTVARERYMTHLIDQAKAILDREPVETLFATPPTLLALAKRLEDKARQRIKGIHFGGMEVTAEVRRSLRSTFPKAVFLSGYGNSLFGVALEMGGEDERDMDYFPVGPRHIIRILKEEGDLEQDADFEETGRIVMSRLDPSGFYPNLVERDYGTRIPPSPAAKKHGFLVDGVRNPHPPKKGKAIRTGFY